MITISIDYEDEDREYFPDDENENTNPILNSIFNSIPDDERRDRIYHHYQKTPQFSSGLSTALKMFTYFEKHTDKTFNVIKTTRAGFTTNCVIASLMQNKKILLVAPTNKILDDTVSEAYKAYNEASMDINKMIRPIPNNVDGCACVVNKLKQFPELKALDFISSEDCESCSKYGYVAPINAPYFSSKATQTLCPVKTILDAYDYNSVGFSPDVLTITYDKFMTLGSSKKSKIFKELISKVDVIVFDEIGDFLSKSFDGYEFYTSESTTEGQLLSEKKISDIKSHLISRIPLIKNTTSRQIITRLYTEYIKPFIDDVLVPNINNNTFPRIVPNVLANTLITEKIPVTPFISRNATLTKQRALIKKYREYYQVLEFLVKEKEDMLMIKTIISLLKYMIHPQLLLYEMDTVKYDPKYMNVRTLYMASAKDNVMQKLNDWTQPGKIVIFSDATMPAHNLKGYTARPIRNIFYGDPSNNNKSCLIYHDPEIAQFSKYRFIKKDQYRDAVLNKLLFYLKIEMLGNTVIWTPSKDIAERVQRMLNTLGYPACDHKEPRENAVIVTYYGSNFTRGVKSNRRYQILLGKSNKPHNAYRHIAFMRRDAWNFTSDKELRIYAGESGIPLYEFKQDIAKWSKVIHLNDLIYLDPEVPPHLESYFNNISSCLLRETIYMNSWQAASRAKDPTGQNKSVNVCIGWTLDEVNEMVKWGSNESISYSPLTNRRNMRTQVNSIPKPYIVSTSDPDIIREWFINGKIPDAHTGFNTNILEGIRSYINMHDTATLKDIWLALSNNNLEFSNNSDRHDNGYLVGCMNAIMMYNPSTDLIIEKIDAGDFKIYKNTNPPKPVPPKKFSIMLQEFENILEVLRAIYLIKENRVLYSNVRKFIDEKKIPSSELKQIWSNLFDCEIFEGSTWIAENNSITKITSDEHQTSVVKSKVKEVFPIENQATAVTDYVIDWYFNIPEIPEIKVDDITDEMHGMIVDNETTLRMLQAFFNNVNYHRFKYLGLDLKYDWVKDPVSHDIIDCNISRENIVY